MARITVIGSLNYDLVTFTDKVPAGGETYQALSFETHLGGKGLNESLAIAKLSPPRSKASSPTKKEKANKTEITNADENDFPVRMIGNVGDDDFGAQLKQILIDNNVDTKYVKTLKGVPSGTATILVEKTNGENRILIVPGANGELKPTNKDYEEYFPQSHEDDDISEFVILQNEFPDTVKTINWIHSNRSTINICYNPSPFQANIMNQELLQKIDILIVNEGEATDIAKILYTKKEFHEFVTAGREGLDQLVIDLFNSINYQNNQTVIITLGSTGCIFMDRSADDVQFLPAEKISKRAIVDTTGAGDTFFGGVVSSLANGLGLIDAIKFATIASSIAIQTKGAAESIPSYKIVKKLA
ncbi:ribokinase [Scheffersomyces coipomensis]|uniref:ribokinase n=1 Tax=Scheffersomyces coipomensis TaxID=1788519 RepID=UPI00315D3AF8